MRNHINRTHLLLGLSGLLLAGGILILITDRSRPEEQRIQSQQMPDATVTSSSGAEDRSSIGPFPANLNESEAPSVVARAPAGYVASPAGSARGQNPESEWIQQAVDGIVGVSPMAFAERLRALRQLSGVDLPQAEAKRLLGYLADAGRFGDGLSRSAMHAVINDLVAVFHDNPNLSDDYLRVSREVIADVNQDEVVRDYALQGLSRAFHHATPEQEEFIRAVFWENVEETETSLAGTSLHGLNRLHRAGALSGQELERLKASAIGQLESESGERTRITAMQVAAELGLQESLIRLEEALDGDASTSAEKAAALAAFVELAPEQAGQQLQRVARSGDSLLVHAANQMRQP